MSQAHNSLQFLLWHIHNLVTLLAVRGHNLSPSKINRVSHPSEAVSSNVGRATLSLYFFIPLELGNISLLKHFVHIVICARRNMVFQRQILISKALIRGRKNLNIHISLFNHGSTLQQQQKWRRGKSNQKAGRHLFSVVYSQINLPPFFSPLL